jgi:hypothetical protein
MCERWGQTSRDDSTNEGLLLQIYVRQLGKDGVFTAS